MHRSDALGRVPARRACEHAAVKPNDCPRGPPICAFGWLSKEVSVCLFVCRPAALPADRPAWKSPAAPLARKLPRLQRWPPTRSLVPPTPSPVQMLARPSGARLPQLRGRQASACTCRSRSCSRGSSWRDPLGAKHGVRRLLAVDPSVLCRLDKPRCPKSLLASRLLNSCRNLNERPNPEIMNDLQNFRKQKFWGDGQGELSKGTVRLHQP
jgi:hypothetical protein